MFTGDVESVNILGIKYKIANIHEHIDGEDNAGYCNFDRTRITIHHDVQSETHVKIVLLHEIIHAVTHDQEIDFGDDDEKYARLLARSMYQLIRENKDLIDYICSDV